MLSTRRLGGLTASTIGFGCMNLSHAYGEPTTPEIARELMLGALDLGVTHFDTAALYGFGANERLLGDVLAPHRSQLTLASKGGMFGIDSGNGKKRVIDGRPGTLRANLEESLRSLKTDVIDLYYLHRWDKTVAIEESVGALADLVAAGKIRSIGLSEVSGPTLRRAHRVHPIAAVQSEYSVLTRNPEINVLEVCREIGASFVAFSPVARGMLSLEPLAVESLAAKDIRRGMPRFEPANYAVNFASLSAFRSLASQLGVTPSQLGLAWLTSRGSEILVIPGTTQRAHLDENVGADALVLDETTLQRLDSIVGQLRLRGNRYNAATRAEVDTEEWPDDEAASA